MPIELLAATKSGLEAVAARELDGPTGLGYPAKPVSVGRVLFTGDESAIARANIGLRTADRILLRIGTFSATDFGVLFDATFALDWERWIPRDGAFPVSGRSIRSRLSSVPACQKIVKKAIVQKLRAAHRVDTLPENGATFAVEVALIDDVATLSIDTTGVSLHKRGYRDFVTEAPLQETLAAAMIRLSVWNPDRPLLDPFCGSGTIPIEAALMARRIAPGLTRAFAAEQWPTLDRNLWQQARAEARDAILPPAPLRIVGADVSGEALALARRHAERAGVSGQITWLQRDFADTHSAQEFGCLIANPPYGERVGAIEGGRDAPSRGAHATNEPDPAAVDALYASFPRILNRLKTWSHFILTPFPRFERLMGREADRRRKLYNGTIECTYYQYLGPKPGTPADAAAEPFAPPPAPPRPRSHADHPRGPAPAPASFAERDAKQAELFRNRLSSRARHLRRLPSRGITCYRLFDRDMPDVPLVVDRYESRVLVVDLLGPRSGRGPEEHRAWMRRMVDVVAEVCETARDNIIVRRPRAGVGAPPRTPTHAAVDDALIVHEFASRFLVDLHHPLTTLLPPDRRRLRAMIRDLAPARRLLIGTGDAAPAAVHALAAGAAAVTILAPDASMFELARRNLELNGFVDGRARLLRADALAHLPTCRDLDLILIDPLMLADGRTTTDGWNLFRDHAAVLNLALDALAPAGAVLFATNVENFELHESKLAPCRVQDISHRLVPPDFENRPFALRCWRLIGDR